MPIALCTNGMGRMIVDFKELSKNQIYFTMIQTIIPRPIAWVLSENRNKSLNLAPFSYFSGICSEPPLLMISVGRKRDGSQKDTWRNIAERTHFIVHIPGLSQADYVTGSAAAYDEDISEIEKLGLATEPFPGSPLPRLADAKAAFYCTLDRIISLGDDSQALILGRIHQLYLHDSVAERDDRRLAINPLEINPLARLGGQLFTGITPPFESKPER